MSGLKKTDRLHPVISICVYYGEEDWDGPLSLTDMLNVPVELKPLISDYKMNLVQVKQSEKYQFHNQDIATVFDIIRLIYNQDYDKINTVYKNKAVDTELALVIGSITQSERIINEALKMEVEGEQMEMCKALQALEQRGVEAGQKAGMEAGLKAGQKMGVETGRRELLKQLVQKKLTKGKSIEIIAEELEEEVSAIQPIIDEIKSEE